MNVYILSECIEDCLKSIAMRGVMASLYQCWDYLDLGPDFEIAHKVLKFGNRGGFISNVHLSNLS